MELGENQDGVEYPAQLTWDEKEAPNALSDVHPRYAIAIRGCSNRVYAVIDPEEEELYKKLLGKGMLSERPWQEKDNIDAVCRLVPLWAEGEARMDWVECDIHKGPSVEERGATKKRKLDDLYRNEGKPESGNGDKSEARSVHRGFIGSIFPPHHANTIPADTPSFQAQEGLIGMQLSRLSPAYCANQAFAQVIHL